MSIFHLSVNIIKKQGKNGKIHSVIASAAYRHRCTMSAVTADLKTAQTYNYKRKNSDLIDEFLMFPDTQNKFLNSLKNEPVNIASELIWQQIELQDKRKDAQFAREVEVSLHHNLTLEQNKALLQQFINQNFTSVGMIADVVIHNPKQKNLHAHILLSMRDIDNTGNSLKIFGKKNRDWNNLDLVNQWRESWEHLSNAAFAKHSVNTEISCKTLAKQREIALLQGNYQKAAELNREPAKHILKEEFSLPGFDDQNIKFDLEKALKTRTEKRKKEIEYNVRQYIKSRISAYSTIFAKIRSRATISISDVRSVVAKQKQRFITAITQRSDKNSRGVAEIVATARKNDNAINSKLQSNHANDKVKNSRSVLLGEVDLEIEKNLKNQYSINLKPK